jgi:hypothetical protein
MRFYLAVAAALVAGILVAVAAMAAPHYLPSFAGGSTEVGGTEVYRVPDADNGVVCYVTRLKYAISPAISCVKVR